MPVASSDGTPRMRIYNMCGWRNFAHLCQTASKGAVATLLLTFALTIVFDLVTR